MNNLIIGLLTAALVAQADARLTLREADARAKAGDHQQALALYQRAETESAPGSADRANAVMGIAAIEQDLGRYPESGRHAREAAEMFRALGDESLRATSLNYAGLAALYAGDYRDAETHFAAAARLSRTTGKKDALAEHLGNLATVAFFVGRYVDATRFYNEALAVAESSPDEPWAGRRRRIILANQAALQQRLSRDDRALALYQQLNASAGVLPPDEQAQLLVNQGVLYRRLGDPIKALTTYDRARALFATHGHTDGELGVLTNRGIVLALDLRRFPEAEQTFAEALEQARRIGNQPKMVHALLYRGETRLRQGKRAEARADYETGLALARELRTPEERWKALYGLGRVADTPEAASSYFEQSIQTIEEIREGIRLPALRSEFLNDKAEVYDALIGNRLRTSTTADIFALIERRHSRGWRDRLNLGSPVTLEAVQRALPEGTLLLDYWHSSQGAAVVAVTRSRAEVIPVSVDTERIRSLINLLAVAGTDWRDLASGLSRQILPPAEWFEGISHVAVVAGGSLPLVPFDLLSIDDRLLVERAAVTYTPSAATLLREAPATPRWRGPWHLQLEAFADPVIASAALDDVAAIQPRLVASADEVRMVASQLNGTARLHVGEDNRKALLFSTERRPPLLHIASHAFADANAMEQSRIMFSPAPDSGADADYLFLREAYGLDLGGVELAVLSACDTARGRIERAEGVQSFSRAFLAAGARSTVTTLWRVADQPTADFMAVFYHHLQSGVGRDEALRRAKVRLLQSGSALASPHYWAAFVLTGDGLRPVPRAFGWASIAGAAAVLAALVAFAAYRVRRRVVGGRVEPASI